MPHKRGQALLRSHASLQLFNSDQKTELIFKIHAGPSFANRGPNRHIYGGKLTCPSNKGDDIIISVVGREILGLGGHLGSVLDRFGPAAALKLRPVALQSKGPKQPK
jgi:hypothetical protein